MYKVTVLLFFLIIILLFGRGYSYYAHTSPLTVFSRTYASHVENQTNTPENLRALYESGFEKLSTTTLLAAVEENPYCHGDSHELGKLIFKRVDNNLSEAFNICKSQCFDGCYHGTLMEAFRPEGVLPSEMGHVTVEDFKKRAKEICAIGENVQSIDECAHAIGHGLLVSTASVERSLTLCKVFEQRGLEYYCSTGVFMQRDIEMGEQDVLRENPMFPCTEFSGTYDVPCYRYKVARLFPLYENVGDVANECKKFENKARLGCFHGLGNAQYRVVVDSPPFLRELCGFSEREEDELACIDGALENVYEITQEGASLACASLESENSREFCNSIHGKKDALSRKTLPLYY